MKNIILILSIIMIGTSLSAQLGGMRVYGGMTTMTNQGDIANPTGESHSGFHIGVDGRLMSGTMSFLVGGRYTAVTLNPEEKFTFVGHEERLSVMNGRVGLGYSLFSVGDIFRVRTKALASFDLVLATKGEQQRPNILSLNDGWLGFVTGLGFDIGPATLDLEYEFGVVNGYSMLPGSKFNSLSLSAGFFF